MRNVEVFTKIDLGSVRVANSEGKWVFCASDMFKILGYAPTGVTMVTNQYCKDIERLDGVSQHGHRPMIFVSKEDVLRVLERSRSKKCPAFKRWLLSEIIPALFSLDAGGNDCVKDDVVEPEVEVITENKAENEGNVMENGVQIFENKEFGKIRTMKINGEPWFVGKDVADALGYGDTDQALRKNVQPDDKLTRPVDGSSQSRSMIIINESGLYSIIFSSKLPSAKEFKHWVTSEVLPSIRQKPKENSVNNVIAVEPTVKERNVEIFSSPQFGKIRIIKEGDNILFCASDVAKALGYGKPNNAVSMHCRATLKQGIPISGKIQEVNFIPESDLYRLVLRSKLPDAEKFTDWVTSEVLPSIRKHGAYMTPDTLENMISSPEFGIRLLTALQEEQNKRKALETVIEEQKPLVDFANQVSLTNNLTNMNKMAKILNDKGVNIGQNRLFRFLREEKILMSNNVPYQEYIDKGYFVVKESVKEMGRYSKTLQTTLVTGKGQQFVCKKVLSGFVN